MRNLDEDLHGVGTMRERMRRRVELTEEAGEKDSTASSPETHVRFSEGGPRGESLCPP